MTRRLVLFGACCLLLCASPAAAQCDREWQQLTAKYMTVSREDEDKGILSIAQNDSHWGSLNALLDIPRPRDLSTALRTIARRFTNPGYQAPQTPYQACRAGYLADQIDAETRAKEQVARDAETTRLDRERQERERLQREGLERDRAERERLRQEELRRATAVPPPSAQAVADSGAAAGRVDSGTAPGSRERREACSDLARARRVAEREFDEWVADCTALAALAVPSVKVLTPELAFDNGGKCVTVSAAKQRIVNGEIETTVALRNSCPVPQLVYAQLKPMTGANLYSAPIWIGPTLPRPQMWPVNNAMPKLPYVPTFERDSGFIINSGTTWTTAVRQNLQSVGDIGVKVGACDSITPARKPRTAFRAADFSGFNCFDIPAAEPSANDKEWQRLMKPVPPAAQPAKKKPTPPPAAKKIGGE